MAAFELGRKVTDGGSPSFTVIVQNVRNDVVIYRSPRMLFSRWYPSEDDKSAVIKAGRVLIVVNKTGDGRNMIQHGGSY